MRVVVIVCFLGLMMGCSSSEDTIISTPDTAPNPIIGTWALQGTEDTIHFLSTGKFIIEPGDILYALNRFQNTQRTRYTSRLLNTGNYEINKQNELILLITADWTGKGTGARRPTNKRVESKIIFDYIPESDSTLTLRKKMLTQGTQTNQNSDEEFELRLGFIE